MPINSAAQKDIVTKKVCFMLSKRPASTNAKTTIIRLCRIFALLPDRSARSADVRIRTAIIEYDLPVNFGLLNTRYHSKNVASSQKKAESETSPSYDVTCVLSW